MDTRPLPNRPDFGLDDGHALKEKFGTAIGDWDRTKTKGSVDLKKADGKATADATAADKPRLLAPGPATTTATVTPPATAPPAMYLPLAPTPPVAKFDQLGGNGVPEGKPGKPGDNELAKQLAGARAANGTGLHLGMEAEQLRAERQRALVDEMQRRRFGVPAAPGAGGGGQKVAAFKAVLAVASAALVSAVVQAWAASRLRTQGEVSPVPRSHPSQRCRPWSSANMPITIPRPPRQACADFAETVYWHPVLVLPSGKAEVAFDLSDSVTTYRALAFGHTLDGRLGAVTQTFDARLPFTLEPKVPIEVTVQRQN